MRHTYRCRLEPLRGQDIFYEEAEGLVACLHAIRADPVVRLLRLRSGLIPSAVEVPAGKCSVGSGDVVVTLQVDSEGTRLLGLHTHVVEVRLTLMTFLLDLEMGFRA